MLRKFPNSEIEFFFSESLESGKYIFESDNFANIDGRTKQEISQLTVKQIRSDNVPQYIIDEMYYWSRNKGFWQGVLENKKGNGETYWVNASIVKINNNNGFTSYGMISTPASLDEIEKAKENYYKLRDTKFNKIEGLHKLLYPITKDL
jgi:PAS domain-containing protein